MTGQGNTNLPPALPDQVPIGKESLYACAYGLRIRILYHGYPYGYLAIATAADPLVGHHQEVPSDTSKHHDVAC